MISVIIPVLNSSAYLPRLFDALAPYRTELEIIAVDGGSIDDTITILQAQEDIAILQSEAGRARQMNTGAQHASGSILVFLHGDTVLEPGWPEAVRAAAGQPDFMLGAFTLKLDHSAWQARWVEWGVYQRSQRCRLPYGDQALFMKIENFKQLGGFPDLPIMEDVELVWKARRAGKVILLPQTATTSARKWVQAGWARRTWRNWKSYHLYKTGRRTAQALYRDYYGYRCAVAVFAKEPTPGRVKTRLAAEVGEETATRIYRHLCEHTLNQISAAEAHSDIYIFFDPPGSGPAMRQWLGNNYRYRPQVEGDLGVRMLDALTCLAQNKYQKVVIIGTDCPGLQTRHINEALVALNEKDLVLGPTADGGYYLVAACDPHPAIFHDMPWSTDQVFTETMQRANTSGLEAALLEEQHDLDTREDLEYHQANGNI